MFNEYSVKFKKTIGTYIFVPFEFFQCCRKKNNIAMLNKIPNFMKLQIIKAH